MSTTDTQKHKVAEEDVASPGTHVFTDVIVAVHGIGEQARFATVRSVASRLADSKVLRAGGKGDPVSVQPLGYFHSDVKKLTSLCLLDDVESLKDTDLAKIGFAEVFWADIPEEVLEEGRTLEETKAWARTVIARANALCSKKEQEHRSIVPPDFDMAGDVLDEIIDTVYVLENLFFLTDKAGLFKFDLRRVLMEYLGDVQLVTEFSYYRKNIIGRFHAAMEDIYEKCSKVCPKVRIHIVAHSEGTVISFLGLLYAMSRQRVVPENPPTQLEAEIRNEEFPKWLEHVCGFMTLGSPIDKHLLLWRRLWDPLKPSLANGFIPAGQIRWRNYYDYGDPIGFKLDSTRLWLAKVGCNAFEFCGCDECHHDIGFARYLLPGQAHNEYWKDAAVFQHFVLAAVKPDPAQSRPDPPGDKWHIALLSPALPYLLSLLVLAAGVFVLFKAVYAYTHPSLDPLQKFVRFSQLGVYPTGELPGRDIFRTVAGITALIAGVIVLARIPRLAVTWSWPGPKVRRWLAPAFKNKAVRNVARTCGQKAARRMWTIVGVVGFITGCVLYAALVPRPIQNEIGSLFRLFEPAFLKGWGPTIGIVALVAVVGLLAEVLMARRRPRGREPMKWDWRHCWALKGIRPLIILGAIGVAAVLLVQLKPPNIETLGLSSQEMTLLTPDQVESLQKARFTSNELFQVKSARGTNWLETVKKVQPVLAMDPSAWPVILAGAGSLYLWWLAALIFDLAFVWHRYIRHSVTNDRLREWNPYDFARRLKPGKTEPCKTRRSPKHD